jgi:chromosome partitioning protein
MEEFNSVTHDNDGEDDLTPVQLPAADLALRVIVFSSQKGGSGKTTLCGQLAVQAELSGGGPVAVIDTDPQGSLSDWWNARVAEKPLFMKASVDYLHEDLSLLERQGVRYVFIDTPPAVTEMIKNIVTCADLVVIPTRPSPHDLRAVGRTIDIVEGRGKPLVFAINDAKEKALITGETVIALSQHGTVAPTIMMHRNDYLTSMIHGASVVETRPDSRAAAEIRELWSYIDGRLDELAPRSQRRTNIYPISKRSGFGRRKPQGEKTAV